MSEAKICMKLLVDKTMNKVIFAEAKKDCLDFFFHVLSLPLGTVVSYLTKESMAGSIGNLYESLENLDTNYLQDGVDKNCLLDPNQPSGSAQLHIPALLTMVNQDSKKLSHGTNSTTHYTCNKHYSYLGVAGVKCPDCHAEMNMEMKYVAPPAVEKTKESSSSDGYVKGLVTYMITDNLCVLPTSAALSIALLKLLGVNELSQLEEREVCLDIDLGAELLKASLMSKTVLTDVFLSKKSTDIN